MRLSTNASESMISAWYWERMVSFVEKDARKMTWLLRMKFCGEKPPTMMLSVPSSNLSHVEAWYLMVMPASKARATRTGAMSACSAHATSS